MNVKSLALKAAALSLSVAAALVNAQSLEMNCNVTVDFTAAGIAAPAGAYKIVENRVGLVTVKNADGRNIALVNLPVKTRSESSASFMTFERRNGVHELAGYCVNGRGCWSSGKPATKAQKIEIALSR